MKEIFLSQNKVAIIDDEDFDAVSKYKWCAVCIKKIWYARAQIENHLVYLHRFLMQPSIKMEVDHKDGNGLNCIRENMRVCRPLDNNRNRRIQKGNTSGYKGVWWYPRLKKWESGISVENKSIHLGVFIQRDDAALAYNEAAKLYYGDFAKLNNIQTGG